MDQRHLLRVEDRTVEPVSDGVVEVLAGLTEGEQIVVTGHVGLRDGSRVLASNSLTANLSG